MHIHKWGQWVKVKLYQSDAQERTCTKCGKVQRDYL